MFTTPKDPNLDRILRYLDANDPGRDDPLIVPSWAGPPDTDEAEIRITLDADGRVTIRMSPAFAEAARKAATPAV
jgi:hypothetical protein